MPMTSSSLPSSERRRRVYINNTALEVRGVALDKPIVSKTSTTSQQRHYYHHDNGCSETSRSEANDERAAVESKTVRHLDVQPAIRRVDPERLERLYDRLVVSGGTGVNSGVTGVNSGGDRRPSMIELDDLYDRFFGEHYALLKQLPVERCRRQMS